MAYEHKEGSGSLFKNNRKEKDTHPDWRGDAMVNGVLMDLAAWIKEGQKGEFLSLSIKPKDMTRAAPAVAKPTPEPLLPGEELPW